MLTNPHMSKCQNMVRIRDVHVALRHFPHVCNLLRGAIWCLEERHYPPKKNHLCSFRSISPFKLMTSDIWCPCWLHLFWPWYKQRFLEAPNSGRVPIQEQRPWGFRTCHWPWPCPSANSSATSSRLGAQDGEIQQLKTAYHPQWNGILWYTGDIACIKNRKWRKNLWNSHEVGFYMKTGWIMWAIWI